MDRERARYLAETVGNALLWLAGIVLIVGWLALWRLGLQIDDRFGVGDPRENPDFDDYLLTLWPWFLALMTSTGILGGIGLYFRWQAVEQDARMSEFDLLLDALGVPVEDEEQPTSEEPPSNG